jgi:predicted phosphoadenosine phosphosulfate sulfurtransferase
MPSSLTEAAFGGEVVGQELEEVTTGGRKIFVGKDVLTAARFRISAAFDRFERIVVSVSGGKDSQIIFELAHAEAVKRDREIFLMFVDQEAEYASSIDVVREMMGRPNVIKLWLQVSLRMTNATSYLQEFFTAWHPGQEWMREKEPDAITDVPQAPDRFYHFIDFVQKQFGEGTAFIVGLRADEALNRFRAVTKYARIPGMPWTSKAAGGAVNVYPIYDWTFDDVWTFMAKSKIRYNRVYDWQYMKQMPQDEMRVSFLLHEHSFRCMTSLQEFEPDTYNKLVNRIGGAHVAAIYADESKIFNADKLPPKFTTWREYRDFLIGEVPEHRREVFEKRFAKQANVAGVHRQQVRQLLINDHEGNCPIINVEEREDPRNKWKDIL